MCERVITLDIYACHNVGNIDVAEKNCDFIYNVIHVEYNHDEWKMHRVYVYFVDV